MKKRRKKKHTKEIKKKFFYKDDVFISRMASILKLPHHKTRELFYQRILSVIRINNLLADPEKTTKILENKNLDMKKVEWSPYTYIVKNKDKSELAKTPEYAKKLFYIQNLSSMVPPIILEPKSTEKILDVCAAPGSKTTQLASLMNNQGEIVANDNNFERTKKLNSILKDFGIKNVIVNFSPGEELGKKFKEHFDKVLLDAPCSGEGMIYLGKKRPLKFWNIRKSQEISKTQKRLITSAFECVKPGGLLSYSTCSLSPNENEGVVTHLLNENKSAKIERIELIDDESFQSYRTFIQRGLKEWNNEVYHPDIKETIRVIPGKTMIGFYVALIRKV